jgi:hypothetical protein
MKHKNKKKFFKFNVLDVRFCGLKASPVLGRPLWRPREKYV